MNLVDKICIEIKKKKIKGIKCDVYYGLFQFIKKNLIFLNSQMVTVSQIYLQPWVFLVSL